MQLILLTQNNKKTLLDELKETECIEEVARLLKPYRSRVVFLEIINNLLNELSEIECEKKQLLRKLKESKEEIELL